MLRRSDGISSYFADQKQDVKQAFWELRMISPIIGLPTKTVEKGEVAREGEEGDLGIFSGKRATRETSVSALMRLQKTGPFFVPLLAFREDFRCLFYS